MRHIVKIFLFLIFAAGKSYCQFADIDKGTQYTFGTVICGDGLDDHNNGAKGGNQNPLSIQEQDTSLQTCKHLYDRGHRLMYDDTKVSYQRSYDTLRLFIESCAMQ